MRKIFLPVMGVMLGLAGCQTASDEIIVESENPCVMNKCAAGDNVMYATPNGNDLVLETNKHVIEIQAQSGTPYAYYVWAGGKDTQSEPDLIIENGQAMVLVEE